MFAPERMPSAMLDIRDMLGQVIFIINKSLKFNTTLSGLHSLSVTFPPW